MIRTPRHALARGQHLTLEQRARHLDAAAALARGDAVHAAQHMVALAQEAALAKRRQHLVVHRPSSATRAQIERAARLAIGQVRESGTPDDPTLQPLAPKE